MIKKVSLFALALTSMLAQAAPPVTIAPTGTGGTIFSAPEQVFVPGKGVMQRWIIWPTSVGRQEEGIVGPVAAYAAGDQAQCSEGDFIMQTQLAHSDLSLISRHKYCQQFQNLPTMMTVDLLQRTEGGLWEFYRPGVSYVNLATVNVGKIGLRTRIHVYGANNVLSKTHKIDVSVTSFEFDPQFPTHLRQGISVQLTADGTYLSYNSSNIDHFSVFVSGTFNSINLTPTSPTGSVGPFSVNFGWNYSGTNSLQEDFVRVVTQVPAWVYTINNTPRAFGRSIYEFPISSESSQYPQPNSMIRCDRGVASGSATPAQGCVMEAAAPIHVMSKSGSTKEAAKHVEDAQNQSGTNNPAPSPGVFQAVPGTRAVADLRLTGKYRGLERGTIDDRTVNYPKSCDNADSLYKTRFYSGSASCPLPTSTNCSCDEYPFAVTKQGGGYEPESTSVRGILKTDNTTGGTNLTNFFRADRVFVGEKFWVKVTP